ncbi:MULTISPECIES: DUF3545 family protein [Thalassotalea]|uniref:DUF3545 family protein n=1 Tax=Thalassotalea castellviae TaxID=3075612 RepID=A0ABU3A3Z0_9GAMM|nr:DUF3545 family protein [Thalassotalea sp. W431]MDT0604897.1 DUF3545 family protein [Thalassotalea sp. W431]
MNKFNWDEFDFINDEEFSEKAVKNKGKTNKRKWREIETIKEQRRLKKQIAEMEQYSF